MPGLIDVDTGLKFGDGLIWLLGGLGGDGFDNIPISATTMVVESPDNTLMLTELSERMLTESAAPSWVLTAGGFEATLDIDFVGNQAWLIPAETTIASLLTCTRATPALASYTNAAGVVSYFAPNTLRYGTNGLLVEEQRINLCLRSQEFDTLWTIVGGTISANAIAAPDSTSTADKFVEAAATSNHFAVSDGITVVDASVYTYSIFAKAAERTWLRIDAEDAAVNAVYFDLANGVVGQVDADSTARIEALANSWYRCIVTRTVSGTSALLVAGPVLVNGGSSNYAGDGSSGLYLWGAQVELGAFATSYIPTTTASVTRAADFVQLTDASMISATNGTFYLQSNLLLNAVAGDRRLLGGGGGNAIFYGASSSAVGSFPQGRTATLGSGTLSGVCKSAIGYSASGCSLVANNGTVDSGTTTMGDVSAIFIGSQTGTGAFINGYYPRFAYWDPRLSNAALQTLTTP